MAVIYSVCAGYKNEREFVLGDIEAGASSYSYWFEFWEEFKQVH
ncbi:MAG: hypothetical protein ACTSQE_17005 [Candidatus Heimdallarchaeaceae archaeon]